VRETKVWRDAMSADNQPKKHSAPKSSVVLARLLDSEGFTPFTASMVRRYALASLATPRQRKRYQSAKRAFSEMAHAKLSEGDRKILGLWISKLLKMSFDSGIRVGLGARLGDPIDGLDDLGKFME
jgi:hypothetical protein